MSKWKNFIYFLSVFSLLIFILIKQFQIEEKIKNTNQIIFNKSKKEQIKNLNKEDERDIILGNKTSNNSLVIYLRYGCPNCEDYYFTTIKKLLNSKSVQVQPKIILRFIGNPSHIKRFKFSVGAYKANECEIIEEYLDLLFNNKTELNAINTFLDKNKCGLDDLNFSNFARKKYQESREVGITATPTTFINGKRYVGVIPFKKLTELLSAVKLN